LEFAVAEAPVGDAGFVAQPTPVRRTALASAIDAADGANLRETNPRSTCTKIDIESVDRSGRMFERQFIALEQG
jgi:hypothetical protein